MIQCIVLLFMLSPDVTSLEKYNHSIMESSGVHTLSRRTQQRREHIISSITKLQKGITQVLLFDFDTFKILLLKESPTRGFALQ